MSCCSCISPPSRPYTALLPRLVLEREKSPRTPKNAETAQRDNRRAQNTSKRKRRQRHMKNTAAALKAARIVADRGHCSRQYASITNGCIFSREYAQGLTNLYHRTAPTVNEWGQYLQ